MPNQENLYDHFEGVVCPHCGESVSDYITVEQVDETPGEVTCPSCNTKYNIWIEREPVFKTQEI